MSYTVTRKSRSVLRRIRLLNRQTRSLWRRLAYAAILGGVSLSAGQAFAGGCPADKLVASGSGQQPGATQPAGVTDTVLASNDLSKESIGVGDRLLRLRRLVIEPGGVVPWHAHANRPAIIYIISGEITEYASTCAEPILHKAGEATTETHATSHWWQNTGKETVVLLSADYFQPKDDPHTM